MAEFGYYEEVSGFGYYEEVGGFGYYEVLSDQPPVTPVIKKPVVDRMRLSADLPSFKSYLLQVNFDAQTSDILYFSYNHDYPLVFPTFYAPRMLQAPNLTKTVVDGTGFLQNRVSRTFGDIQIKLNDRFDDPLLDKNWEGADFFFMIGPHNSQNFSEYETVYIGMIDTVSVSQQIMTLSVKGAEKIVEEAKAVLDSDRYLGTGKQPDNTDEGPPEFEGLSKIRIHGSVFNFQPTLLDATLNIYHFDAVTPFRDDAEFDARDSGILLTNTGSVTDLHTHMFNPGATGEYVRLINQSYIRLAAPSTNQIVMTFNEVMGNSEPTSLFTQIGVRYLSGEVALGTGDLNPIPGLTTQAGIFLDTGNEPSISQLFDQIARSIGAFWYIDRLNVCRLGRIDPDATPTRTITQVLRDPRPTLTHNAKPIWRVIYNYKFNQRVLAENELADDPNNNDLNLYKPLALLPSQQLESKDQTILDDNPSARTLEINSIILNEPSARVESDRILELGKPERALFAFSVFNELFTYDIVEPLRVQIDNFSFVGSVVSVNEDTRTQQSRITLLGKEEV